MLLSFLYIIICMLTLLEPVLSFPRLGNSTNLVVRNDPPNAVGPKILLSDFSDPEKRQKIQSGINGAIYLANLPLDASQNDKEFFMSIYDKYFPRRTPNWKFWKNGQDPRSRVMGWCSSLSYINIIHVLFSSWVIENETNYIDCTFLQFLGVFKTIVGKRKNGNTKLKGISIRRDLPDRNKRAFCRPGNPDATFDDASSKNPRLVLCNSAIDDNDRSISGNPKEMQHVCNVRNFDLLKGSVGHSSVCTRNTRPLWESSIRPRTPYTATAKHSK